MDYTSMAPSSCPDPDLPGFRDFVRLGSIFILINVSVIVLFLLHVLGSLRRVSSHKLLHAVVLGAYTLSYSLVAYTLGLMQRAEKVYVEEFPLWAVCLFILLGVTDNLMAWDLGDIDNWKGFYIKHLIKGGLVIYIVLVFSPGKDDPKLGYEPLLWAILFISMLQSYARINSMRRASKSHLLRKNVKPIADYMQLHEDQRITSRNKPNPITMEGYRYIVTGERTEKNSVKMDDMKITTVEQIWQCEGSLLCSKRGSWLKDLCLSMALSKMLNRRFACFQLVEAGLQKTHDFIFKGLLDGDKHYERAFKIIEIELAFVYDLYYTRYPYLYQKGRYFWLLLPIAMVILCLCITYQLNRNYRNNHEDNPMTKATLFLMAMVTFLEVFQLYLYMASGWFKVALIRSYVTLPALQSCRCFSETIIALVSRLKPPRPWERKLGQYSFLHRFDCKHRKSNFIHYATLCLVDKAKKGCKRGKLAKLSMHVKKAVIDSLIQSNGNLTNGVRSLQNNGVHEQLSWACEASNGTTTRTILVWHIATTYCKHELDAQAKNKQLPALSEEDSSAVNTASCLSQYCAYLIAFAPDLLPDHSFVSASVLDDSIEDAKNKLQGAKTMRDKCEKLLNIGAADGGTAVSVVVMGARLARKLSEDIQDLSLRWKILSEFWAEMILYLAPCNDDRARAHLEALARGGEFITHLWALLTHAGVVERPTGPLSAV